MKKLVHQFHTFGVDSPRQIVREVTILIGVILLTVALGFVLSL